MDTFFNQVYLKRKRAFEKKDTRHYNVIPAKTGTMLYAGIENSDRQFITHTTLPLSQSAFQTLTPTQKMALSLIGLVIFLGFTLNFLLTLQLLIAFLSGFYFFDGVFNFYVIYKSLGAETALYFSQNELKSLRDDRLPIYSILCPLYREAQVLPAFLRSIESLDYPKDKLDVLLLLEEDDKETIRAVQSINLPPYVGVYIVPDSQPKTKPKACNFGLSHARGEFLVIYDAEDNPEPDQLKKAYLGFMRVDRQTVCLQAKLNYFNPHQNLITRLFTAEYSLWFDVILPGLQSLGTNIPLGGTSNHFRIEALRELKGWDPFNVTEDCDLGTRLFMEGYKTSIIDSTTYEEANSQLGNWIRQRSRWIKGYMQTYLVHMRQPVELFKKQGRHAWLFQLIIGGKIAFMFINPILWIVTISYFALNYWVGSAIESVYTPLIYFMAVFSLVFGNFICFYFYMIGLAKRGHWDLIKYVFLIPIYWLMASTAAFYALYQLIVKPHYWEKTVHGLNPAHLNNLKVQPAFLSGGNR